MIGVTGTFEFPDSVQLTRSTKKDRFLFLPSSFSILTPSLLGLHLPSTHPAGPRPDRHTDTLRPVTVTADPPGQAPFFVQAEPPIFFYDFLGAWIPPIPDSLFN